ncbi:TetR/AcrR family transcriptional regulator [Chromobacterium sp. IIBBL 290-4]|uniref:TetR/AcrR family transcriptional regulator n=1 Tax=Chromobacterium sp. IIBBL 290-4 TaxID=2953890 RepID=UPI0020B89D5E|nr:TetR/AcrR family transcriptional regulator [Chromobacterium sp. IIBBL 290-4]UTH76663.1 TetR/AcrR family transcriptional regulator [Chromobacterium sp. IIBBL 290-4]
MTDTPSSRWQRKKEARPSEILDAALTLFVEKGFRATKIEDIAQAAGVTKGTPYLYFQNKEEIFKAVARETIVSRVQAMSAHLEQLKDLSSSQLLFLALEDWWTHIGATRAAGLCKLMVAEATNFPELALFYYEEVIHPARQLLGYIVERGIARGEFRPVHLDYAIDALVAPMLSTMILGHSFALVPGCCSSLTQNPLEFLQTSLSLLLQGMQTAPLDPQS